MTLPTILLLLLTSYIVSVPIIIHASFKKKSIIKYGDWYLPNSYQKEPYSIETKYKKNQHNIIIAMQKTWTHLRKGKILQEQKINTLQSEIIHQWRLTHSGNEICGYVKDHIHAITITMITKFIKPKAREPWRM